MHGALKWILFLVASVAIRLSGWAVELPEAETYTVAIFTANRAGAVADGELRALEDYVSASVTSQGIRVVSMETALEAVAGMAPGANADVFDGRLAQSSSAVRLAQTLGATHLLHVTLTGYHATRRTVNAYGVKTANDELTVRVTYKILDGNTGASLAADTVQATKTMQNSHELGDVSSGRLNELLGEAAVRVATSLKRQLDRGGLTRSADPGMVTVEIATELGDVFVPDIRIGASNTVSITADRYKVSALAATVEIDGIAIGTAPGKFETRAGLHKLRVMREGFKPWERTVNLSQGQKLNVVLEMTDAAYVRWQDATRFMNDLKNGASLTDAQVEVLKGQARMLEKSGFRVNVDTKEGITLAHRSIFGL